jgi:tetratricopeptide (TPR) repeat protein
MMEIRRSCTFSPLALACSALLSLLLSTASAAISAGDFDSANKLFDQGRFTDAASAYQKLLASGHASAAIYFNLGNAWFKSGQIGRAIDSYHKAEHLSPRDPDVLANLQFARNQVQGPTLLPNWWQRWLARLNLNEWTLLAAGSFWTFFLLLGLQQWAPTLKTGLRSYILAIGITTMCCGVCFVIAFQDTRVARSAVVIAREAVARQGPLEESPEVLTLHDGAELRILDRKDDWFQVTTGPRRIGWVRQNLILLTSRTTL